MKKIGLIFSSHKGQTKKIIEYIAKKLSERNISTEIIDVGHRQNLKGQVDGLILGAPVYAGSYPKALLRWARNNRPLFSLPTAFFLSP